MFILQHLNDEGNRVFSKVRVDDRSTGPEGKQQMGLVVKNLKPPYPEKKKHEVVGFCNGLFLLEYDNGTDVIVWNPLLSEFTNITAPPQSPSPACPKVGDCGGTCELQVVSRFCGLGFDPKSKDYKVVRLVSNYFDHPTYYNHACLKQAQVYSIKEDCWQEIEVPSDPCRFDVIRFATCVEGICYWIAETRDSLPLADFVDYTVIISFDLANHKFSTIKLPTILSLSEYNYNLMDFNGRLGLLSYHRMRIQKYFSTCVLEIKDGEYRWTEEGFKVWVEAERALGYVDHGQVLFLEGLYGKLLVYDSGSQKLSKVDQLHDYPHRMQLFPLSVTPPTLKFKCPPGQDDEEFFVVETLDTSTIVEPFGTPRFFEKGRLYCRHDSR